MMVLLQFYTIFLFFVIQYGDSFVRRPWNSNRSILMNSKFQLFDQLGLVTMYFKETCPYCKNAKEILVTKYGLNVTFVDVEGDNKEEKLYQLRTFSGGRNTVPQIFFNSEHLGGNDDLVALDGAGELIKKVENVKANPVSMMLPNWYHPWY